MEQSIIAMRKPIFFWPSVIIHWAWSLLKQPLCALNTYPIFLILAMPCGFKDLSSLT